MRDRHDVGEIRAVGLACPPHAAAGVSEHDDLVALGDEGLRLESEDFFSVLSETQPLEDAGVASPRAGGRIERIVWLAPLDVGTHGGKKGRDVTARERGVEIAYERHVLAGGVHRCYMTLTSTLRGRAFADFGRCTVSTPSLKSAAIFCWSTSVGTVRRRTNLP